MNKLIISIFIITLISCTKKNNNTIDLYNDVTFEMHAGESLMEIQPNIKELYSEYFNHLQPQIPLFKYLKHSNYKIFIGIPYNTSIKKMIKAQLEKSDSSSVFFKSNSNSFFTKYKKDGYYITEYATELKEHTILYISTMTSMKDVSDSLFNMNNMTKRLN